MIPAVLFIAVSCAASFGYSEVAVDAEALPSEIDFLPGIIDARISRRVPSPDVSLPKLTLGFVRDTTLAREESIVKIQDGSACVYASSIRGFVFGAGQFLRALAI